MKTRKLRLYQGFWALIILLFVSCTDENTVKRVLTPNMKAALESAADDVFLATGTPGLIAEISVEGEVSYLIKRGVAHLSTGSPMHEDNSFRIASVTKTFTGTAILILVDEGLIDLDASIDTYLPEYDIPSGDKITVRMLGNMTSGLFDYSTAPELWTDFIESNYQKTFPPDSLLAIAFRHENSFEPGTDYEYCNTNTILLGVLIEKITDMSAGEFIKEKILVPLKLNKTYMGSSYFLHTPYTHGYTNEDDGLLDATNFNPSWGYTAGAMVSDLYDMKVWAKALAKGDLLSDAMKAEQMNFGADGYGFGMERVRYKNDIWVGHPGIIPGYNTQVWYNPQRKISMVVNANTNDGTPAEALFVTFLILITDLTEE